MFFPLEKNYMNTFLLNHLYIQFNSQSITIIKASTTSGSTTNFISDHIDNI